MRILNLTFESIENAGCNNGNYPAWSGIDADTGKVVSGITCNCLAGCAGTDRLESYNRETKTAILIEDE